MDIYSNYPPEMKYRHVMGKNLQKLPISNPKPDLHIINAHTKFAANPLTFTQVIIRELKYRCIPGR